MPKVRKNKVKYHREDSGDSALRLAAGQRDGRDIGVHGANFIRHSVYRTDTRFVLLKYFPGIPRCQVLLRTDSAYAGY